MSMLKKCKCSFIVFVALLSLVNIAESQAAGLVELRLTEGKIVSGPDEVKGKKLGDFKQWYEGNNASISLSKDTPNGRYDVRWSEKYPAEARALVVVAELKKNNINQYNNLYVSCNGGKTWFDIGGNSEAWKWEHINMTLPRFFRPADGKIHISWRFNKPHNGGIWKVGIRNVETDPAEKEDVEELYKTGNIGWVLAGKIVSGPENVQNKKLSKFDQWFVASLKDPGIMLSKDAPNGNYEVRWSANIPADAEKLLISAELRKHNCNQGNTLSASIDGGTTWKEIGRNTPKGWVWEKVKVDLPLPSPHKKKVIIRWNFNKPHNNEIWRLGIRNIKIN